MTELELDQLFWNAIGRDNAFQKWFIQQTKFKDCQLKLLDGEEWHHRWYRDPVSNKDSETDITLTFADQWSCRYAIHIENKPSWSIWRPFQAENYRPRALNRMHAWGHADYQTAS